MEISDWHGAHEFELLRQRAIGFRSQQTEPLDIEWHGEGKDLARMADPNSDPKSEWINPHREHSLEKFFCWLMLPKDVSGGEWYFGRVSTRHRSKTQELDEFLAIASKGGHLLRQDTLFGKYLSPCVEHTKFAQRFPCFHDHLDLSFWCAFLFTNRGLSHPPGMLPTKQQPSQEHPGFPIDFPYAKFKGGDDVVEGSIPAALQFTGKLISRWALNTSQPARPLASVARPFVWPTAEPTGGSQAGAFPSGNGHRKEVIPRVKLNGQSEQPEVDGESVGVLTNARYNVVDALLKAGPDGLKKRDLVSKSGHSSAVNVLKGLAKVNKAWNAVVKLPGSTGKKYALRFK